MRLFKFALTAAATASLGASVAAAQQKTTYSYDAHGQLTAAKKIEAETTYAYDLASNRRALSYRRLYPVLQSWEAEEMSWHQVGHADGDGWAADATTADGLMTYGPYLTNAPVGDNVAVWKLTRAASTLPASQPVVVLSVFDSTQWDTIASRTITLADWPVAARSEYFTVPFNLPASRKGHYLEFYTRYVPSTYVKLDRLGLTLPTPTGAQAGTATTSWEAEGAAIGHIIGFAEGDGWAASTASAAGFMTYGPYVSTLTAGEHTALWTLMIDNNDYDEQPIVRLEVYDAALGDVITDRTLTRPAWALTMQHETFGLPFTLDAARAGHPIEFRTYAWSRAYVRVDKVGVR